MVELPEIFGMSPSVVSNLQCDLGQVTKSQRLLHKEEAGSSNL